MGFDLCKTAETMQTTYHSVQRNRPPFWLWSTADVNHCCFRILRTNN